LPATTIFDHPTPTTLTEHLHQQLTPNTADMAQDATARTVKRILSALDGVKGMLASIPAADVAATRISTHLHALLAELDGPEAAGKEADVADQLESASADELFKFIDSEL
ncbi:hypothetical protein, partial [Streptomyces sp. NPDC047525]|uniref:hypothetical protein n=1 Tax=Streptomyces sp. NPDC047525 TaxID=3155264 RepID=UPI0033CC2E00